MNRPIVKYISLWISCNSIIRSNNSNYLFHSYKSCSVGCNNNFPFHKIKLCLNCIKKSLIELLLALKANCIVCNVLDGLQTTDKAVTYSRKSMRPSSFCKGNPSYITKLQESSHWKKECFEAFRWQIADGFYKWVLKVYV